MTVKPQAKHLHRQVRLIVALTIAYNVIEAIVALAAGAAATSGALIGFGLDSVIEVSSAVIVAWQFTRRDPERYEKPALRGIALAFYAVAAYVAVEATFALVGHHEPEVSVLGVGIAAASVLIMPALSRWEASVGRRLGSQAVVADSKQLMVCWYLSVAVLVGLLLHALVGWWWADPVAALVIAVLAAKEGRETWTASCTCSTRAALVFEPGR